MNVRRFVFLRLAEPSASGRRALADAIAAVVPGATRWLPFDDAALRAWDLGLVLDGPATEVAANAERLDEWLAGSPQVQVAKAWTFSEG